jgi:hypothetical protein
MRFSMNSYLLGVGTVVGALAFGFGGGILLTRTAIKESPAGPSRMERVARPEPTSPQVQTTEARAVPVPRADPVVQPVPEPAPQVQAAAETPKPVVEPAKENPARIAEPVKQPDVPKEQPVRQVDAPRQAEQAVRQADAPKQIEQREAGQEMTAREQSRAEREQRRAERRMERERYYAERKARTVEYARMRQRPIEIQEQPRRPELAFEREEPRQPNLFEGLFGRPAEAAPAEKE